MSEEILLIKEHIRQTKQDCTDVKKRIKNQEDKLDRHIEIYAKNGKELEAVKINQAKTQTNQEWLMKFFWLFMTPIAGGIIYIALRIN